MKPQAPQQQAAPVSPQQQQSQSQLPPAASGQTAVQPPASALQSVPSYIPTTTVPGANKQQVPLQPQTAAAPSPSPSPSPSPAPAKIGNDTALTVTLQIPENFPHLPMTPNPPMMSELDFGEASITSFGDATLANALKDIDSHGGQ